MTYTDYHYQVYGLHLVAPLALPALVPAVATETAVDVHLSFATFEFPSHTLNADGFALVPDGDCIYLIWQDVGRFCLRGGREIRMMPADGVSDDVLRLFIQGTTLALLLYQRGQFVLHASAVAVAGQVAVFVGDKGAGKSTTAAALCQRGHALIADDIVVIDMSDPQRPLVIPGYPQVKLWTESVVALGAAVEDYDRLRADTDKYAWLARDTFSPAPLPLSRVYVLSLGDSVAIQAAPGGPATMLLLRFLYASRFGAALVSPDRAAGHMQAAAGLAPMVRILQRATDITRLAELGAAIEADIAGHSAS